MNAPAMIDLQGATIGAGSTRLVNLSLSVPAGAYAVLLGKTGCGKTTLLETLCGLRPLHEGTLHLDGQDVQVLDPADRGMGYVPQDGALFPTMTVTKQLGFSLVLAKKSQQEQQLRIAELAQQLGLVSLLDRLPDQLSGGERQRVALGRALANRPKILLLDEPLASLDEDTRASMQAVLAEIHASTSCTVLHVTHRKDEAQTLGSLIFDFEADLAARTGLPTGLDPCS